MKREEKKQLASEEEKTEADNEEKTEEDNSRDSAKMHVAYGIVMCKLALSAYSASEIDSLSLKSMLSITKREDISSLQQKVF